MKRKNPSRLNFDDAVKLQGTVESEGFDYAFRSYSDFQHIKDKKFHNLRKAYVKAAQALVDYARIEEDLLCVNCGTALEYDECPKCPNEEESLAPDVCGHCGDALDEDGTCATCVRQGEA